MTAGFAARGSDAALAATKQLALMVRRQAMVLALADVFLALTVVFFLSAGCVADAPAADDGRRRRRALRAGSQGTDPKEWLATVGFTNPCPPASESRSSD